MSTFTSKFPTFIKMYFCIFILTVSTTSFGDDTEVFSTSNNDKPNLLFVLDVSGSMSTRVENSGTVTSEHTVSSYANDDGEQSSYGGPMLLDDNRLDLGYYYDGSGNKSELRVGLRFSDLGLPKDAEINNAYIQFRVGDNNENTDSEAQFVIKVEASDNANSFQIDTQQISTRTFSGIDVNWDPVSWGSSGGNIGARGIDQRTSDISVLIQTLVDRDGWDDDNAMVFVIEGRVGNEGTRLAASKDEQESSAPSLHIEYTTVDEGENKTRLEVLQESLRAVLDDAPSNVNVGVMNYGQEALRTSNSEKYRMHSVSGVSFPITDINALARDVVVTADEVHGLPNFPSPTTTVREYIADIADSWTPSNWTPIVDSLYEAALYYRGEKVHYGHTLPTAGGAHPSTYIGETVSTNVFSNGRDRSTAPTYKSPITTECGDNYIALMTDGAPTYRKRYSRIVRNNRGGYSRVYYDGYTYGPFATRGSIDEGDGGPEGSLADGVGSCITPSSVGAMGQCGAEITQYLATNDNRADIEGDQFISTFTIGFGTDEDTTGEYLKSLATYENGDDLSNTDEGYFSATSAEELAAAFAGIIGEVTSLQGNLASPGYSVNVKNGLENENNIYVPVFDRKSTSRWTGNLKKFKIISGDDDRLIQGKNNLNATDDDGNFTDDALDFWSENTTADGSSVEAGGVASLLKSPATRNVVSNLMGDSNIDLTSLDNEFSIDNLTNITNSTLGLSTISDTTEDIALRIKIINFMRGFIDGDSSKGPRKHMGDLLHTEPLIVTYEKGSGDDDNGKKQYVFAGTNEGYLHAFDVETGEEQFAFIPRRLLKIADPQMRNTGSQDDHKYGVDGIMSFNFSGGKDGSVDSGDQIILYFGLRRGGTSYYALDVTDITNPKLLWTKSAEDYDSMGQSWSKPYLAKVGKSGSSCSDGQSGCKNVVIISGGYDDDEDRDISGTLSLSDSTTEVLADVGNDILILDAEDGSEVWSMPASMRNQIKNSIPGGVSAVDYNQNGLIDRLYFGDTGGNVWRLDLSETIGSSSSDSQVTTLTKFADLGTSGSGNRMFFNQPEVARLTLTGKDVFIVSIGSGFRAHPLDTAISDKFYVLIDDMPYTRIDDTTTGSFISDPLTGDDLASASINASNVVTSGDDSILTKKGWAFDFSIVGEKVLSQAYTSYGKVIFSTLVPPVSGTASADGCDALAETNNITYVIDILSGNLVSSLVSESPGIANIVQSFFNEFSVNEEVISDPYDLPSRVDMEGNIVDSDGIIVDACEHLEDLRKGTNVAQLVVENTCKIEPVYWSDPVQQR